MANRMGPCFQAQAVGLIPSGKELTEKKEVAVSVVAGQQCLCVEKKTTTKKNTHKPCLCFDHVHEVRSDCDEEPDPVEDDFTPFRENVQVTRGGHLLDPVFAQD